jgi:C_GCAxxG_C_C family probable redox protein
MTQRTDDQATAGARPAGIDDAPDRAADPTIETRAALERARRLFLDESNEHGCAETTYLALAEAYGLETADGSAPAMAFNGGIAYSGGPCGAVTGAAMAVGLLAERRIPDHRAAKRAARELVWQLMDAFAREHGSLDCRDLIGVDLRAPGEHDAFIAGGAWRDRCMLQIEVAIRRLAPLGGPDAWDRAIRGLDAAEA